ncbi:hypothetical protein SprV_0301094600 [Sparganum proliferum]
MFYRNSVPSRHQYSGRKLRSAIIDTKPLRPFKTAKLPCPKMVWMVGTVTARLRMRHLRDECHTSSVPSCVVDRSNVSHNEGQIQADGSLSSLLGTSRETMGQWSAAGGQ